MYSDFVTVQEGFVHVCVCGWVCVHVFVCVLHNKKPYLIYNWYGWIYMWKIIFDNAQTLRFSTRNIEEAKRLHTYKKLLHPYPSTPSLQRKPIFGWGPCKWLASSRCQLLIHCHISTFFFIAVIFWLMNDFSLFLYYFISWGMIWWSKYPVCLNTTFLNSVLSPTPLQISSLCHLYMFLIELNVDHLSQNI